MTPRQEAFADAQAEAEKREAAAAIYIIARQNGASHEHAIWLVQDWRARCQ